MSLAKKMLCRLREIERQKTDRRDDDEHYSKVIVASLKNAPLSPSQKLILESVALLEEGRTREWGKGYRYRIDVRPEHMGGNQIHIYGPQGQAWAYRSTGARSEPGKYRLATTNVIRDIVSDAFGIESERIEEVRVVDATAERVLVEVMCV